MKRLTPPILAFYKDAQLAAALDIPHWQVQQACQNGDIQAEFVPERTEVKYRESNNWVSSYTGKSRQFSSSYRIPAYWKIPKAEALRLEAELFKSEEAEKQQPEQLQTKKRRNPDNPKSQNTLLQMIAVMAIKGYKYNPDDSRSTVPATIVNSAQSMGITLDPKTVREWLQQAAECGSSEE